MKCGLLDKRAVGDRIIERQSRFQMRSGYRELPTIHQVSTGRQVAQNEPGGIVALLAQTQQILVQALRQIEFAPEPMMAGLPEGNPKEFRRRTQPLPKLSCAGIGLARLRRPLTSHSDQRRAQSTEKFDLLSLAFGAIWQ